MSLWRQLTRGLRVLANRDAADCDLADEVDDYLERSAAAFRDRGSTPEEASRLARMELGNSTMVREQVRAGGWEHAIETALSDVGFAARRLRGSPGFTAVSVVTLALGIGGSTAILSAVNPILFEPLPYPDAGRIMMIWYPTVDGSRGMQTFATFRELQTRSRAFEALAVYKPWQRTLAGAAEPERFDGQLVSARYFRVLAVSPAIGRDFDPADDRPNGPRVVMLSNALWRRRFGADATIVGRQITLNETLYTVAGVMPGGFENVLAPSVEIWSLLQYDPSLPAQGREWGHHLQVLGRVRTGQGTADARRELDTIARMPVPEFPRAEAPLTRGLIVDALQDHVTRAVRPALLAVLGAVLLVLAIACVNVTNLLLARSAQRRGELAMRAALGAGRSRLIRQLLTESLLLALIGGALGMAIAGLGVRALIALAPPGLPRAGAVGVDRMVLAAAFALSSVIGVTVGLIPALHTSREDLQTGLQRGSWRTAGGHHRTRWTLVVTEIALAVVLLVSAGLLLRSLERLFDIAPGFEVSQRLTMQVQLSSPRRFPDNEAFHRYYAQVLDVVRQVPGVRDAAFTSMLPLSGDDASIEVYAIQFEARANAGGARVDALRYAVTPSYFETMGIPLRGGRLLNQGDAARAAVRPVVISESFAKRTFADRDPIGQRLRFGGPADRPWDVIVGVVGDVKQTSLAATNADAVYVVNSQWLWAETPMWLVVRARGNAGALTPIVKTAIWSVDKDQPIVRVATLDQLLTASEAQRQFVLIVLEAFGLVALVLAAIGIYGVLSGSVVERTREIGVRAALGASRADIVGLVVGQGMALTGAGIVFGLLGTLASTRAVVTLLFGVSRLDPATYVGVVVVLGGVSGIACWVPAWRAARVDPAITLRAE